MSVGIGMANRAMPPSSGSGRAANGQEPFDFLKFTDISTEDLINIIIRAPDIILYVSNN